VSTIVASSSDDPYARGQALRRRGQQGSAPQGDAASQSLAPTSSQSTNTPASKTRSVLLVVLPSDLGAPQLDASKKTYRTYLAFPYGVLTIASYLKRFAAALAQVEILDLNLPGDAPPEALLARTGDAKPAMQIRSAQSI